MINNDNKNVWYDGRELLSHNRLLNMVVSHRGGGKTYFGKRMCINNFLKKGEEFVYLRRFKTEGKELDKFFDDISSEFPGHEFSVKGKKFYINGKLAGHFVTLSQQVQIRSVPFPNVTFILFDEFILPGNGTVHYINKDKEPIVFFEVLSTIIRSRENCRVLMCANSISYVNPYFKFFNIRVNPSDKKRFYKPANNKQVILEMYQNGEFENKITQTKFGQLIQGTEYGDYAIGNEVLEDDNKFIMFKRPGDSKFKFSFLYDSKVYGCWYSDELGIYHVSHTYDPSHKTKISVTTKDHDIDYSSIKSVKKSWTMRSLKVHYENGMVFYADNTIKNAMLDILKLLGI